jgi:hypothetical protein
VESIPVPPTGGGMALGGAAVSGEIADRRVRAYAETIE